MLDEFRSTSITWDKATRRIYSPITANASDSNGRKLNIQVVNSGQVENLTGATLHLYWETKDKTQHGLDAFTASDISKGEFEIFYTTGMLSNVGELNATLVLVDSTGKVVSDWFKITVTRGINEDVIESENSFSSLTQALIDISNLEQNYAPRLNDLTAQLQQTATKAELSAIATPKAVSLVSQMTDVAKIYVYTGVEGGYTAGNWYYHNGTAWVSGGVYQATGLSDASLTDKKLVSRKVSRNLFDKDNYNVYNGYNTAGAFVNSATAFAIYIAVEPNTTYTIRRPMGLANRFNICGSAVVPTGGGTYGSYVSSSAEVATITTQANEHYLYIWLYNGAFTGLDIASLVGTLQIEKGAVYTGFRDHFILDVKNDNLADGAVTEQKLDTSFLYSTESNLYSEITTIPNGYYDAQGVFFENTSWKVLKVANVKAGRIKFNADAFNTTGIQIICGFDGTDTLVKSYVLSSYTNIVDLLSDYAYITFNVYTSYHTPLKVYKNPDVNADTIKLLTDSYFINSTNVKNFDDTSNKLKGKVINALGDSFTASTQKWHTYLSQRTGCIVNNYGVSGSAITDSSDPYAPSFLTRYPAMTDTCDVVIVFGGINDSWLLSTERATVGDMSSTSTNTIYGALKALCEGLIAKYPTKTILALLPPNIVDNGVDSWAHAGNINPVCEAQKAVYTAYGIPFLDLRSASKISTLPAHTALYNGLQSDGITTDMHWKAAGYERASYPIQTFIEANA